MVEEFKVVLELIQNLFVAPELYVFNLPHEMPMVVVLHLSSFLECSSMSIIEMENARCSKSRIRSAFGVRLKGRNVELEI
jgi:hypothetical protein